MKNIVLIGFMGSGKSTIGKRLSEVLNLKFIDTDAYIEHNNGKINDIFKLKGEEYFRKLETSVLKELIGKEGLVVATGGGIVTDVNILLLQKLGTVFYLKISEETAVKRLKTDTQRPLLAENKVQAIKNLMNKRKNLYISASDITIEADNLSVNDIISRIKMNITR